MAKTATNFVFEHLILLKKEVGLMPGTRFANKRVVSLATRIILLRSCLSKSGGIYLIISYTNILYKFWISQLHCFSNLDFKQKLIIKSTSFLVKALGQQQTFLVLDIIV